MKKSEVKIGRVCTAKVTNKVVQVRIDAETAEWTTRMLWR